MKALIVLLLIGCVQSVFGQDDQIIELCEGIQQYRSQATQSPRKLLWRTLRLRFFPSLYSKPLSQILPTQRPVHAPKQVGQKNLVFFVGLPRPLVEEAQAFEAEYKKIQEELVQATKKFRFLANTKSVTECVALAQERALDLEQLKELNHKIQSASFQHVQRFKETQAFRRELRQLQGQLSADWQVRVVTHISDLQDALRSPDITNAVIVTHGKVSGHIIDSFDNQYPNGFFSDLSPSLYSLSFFNCYGAATLATYDLKTKLSLSPSFYTERLLTVADAPSSSEADQVAPIRGFDSFMRRLDQRLKNREKKLVKITTPHQELESCEISTQASFGLGTPSVSLNGKFLGVLKGHGETVFTYPCEWKKTERNLIQLTNISPIPWDLKDAPDVFGFEKQVFTTPEALLRSVIYRDN